MRANQGRHAVDEDPTSAACRAEEQATAHSRLVDLVLRAECRVRRPASVPRPRKPLERPRGAEDVLAKLATRHQAGEVLGISQVASSSGCSTGAALAIRRWAKSVGRWPYREGGVE